MSDVSQVDPRMEVVNQMVLEQFWREVMLRAQLTAALRAVERIAPEQTAPLAESPVPKSSPKRK